MDEVKTMKIPHSVRDFYQLWKPVIPTHADTEVITHKLDSVHVPVVPDELVDVPVLHPL